jgi:hypothetical protein
MTPNESKEYNPSDAMLMARLINGLNVKTIEKGASFAQQYLLNKGIKVFGQRKKWINYTIEVALLQYLSPK